MVYHHVMRLALALAALVSLSGGSAVATDVPVDPLAGFDISALQTGDLIFRQGRGYRAAAVELFGGGLTHVGIVEVTRQGAFVIHAAPPEGDFSGGVVRVPLSVFARSADAIAVSAYRRRGLTTKAAQRIALAADRYAQDQTPFDDAFRLDDSGRAIYCTELVWRASRDAGVSFVPRTTRIGVLVGSVMTPSDLLRSIAERRIAWSGQLGHR